MRYIIATFSNGYCGCDVEEYWAFPNDWADIDIEKYLSDGLFDYAEGYAPNEIESDDDWEAYFEDCSVDFREATPEEIEEIGIDEFMLA